MRTLVDHFRNITVAGYYISTIAQRASLSRQRKAMERSEKATSSHSTAQPIADYHAYRKYSEYLLQIPPYSGPAAVVPLYKHPSHDSNVSLTCC